MLKKQKSISAIISVVLLILVTSVLVAGFLSWSKTTARDQLDVSGEQLQSVSKLDCLRNNFVVESCNINFETGELELLLRNPTSINFYDLAINLIGKDSGSSDILKIYGKFNNPLKAGEIKLFKTSSDFTYITNDTNISEDRFISPDHINTFNLTNSTCSNKTIDLKKCKTELPD